MMEVACDYRNVSKPSKNIKALRKILRAFEELVTL